MRLKILALGLFLLASASLVIGLYQRQQRSHERAALAKATALQHAASAGKSTAPMAEAKPLGFCAPIAAEDRARIKAAAGHDLVAFIEESTHQLHAAKNAEDMLRTVAQRFDHQRWTSAWIVDSRAETSGVETTASRQLGLTHATSFLARYQRLLQNGRRLEDSAIRGFQWPSDAISEMRREPVRAMVRDYRVMDCEIAQTARYGCRHGEKIWILQTVLSPRVACRFQEKREQYQAAFWLRTGDHGPRVMEVESGGQRLVSMTYDELAQRELLVKLASPGALNQLNDLLIAAGLDPFRAPALWRFWLSSRPSAKREVMSTRLPASED